MRTHLLRALVLGTFIAGLIAAGGYYAYAQSATPEAGQEEPPAEAAGAWLGVAVVPFTEQAATRLNLPYQPGILAVKVVKDGPAAKAGLQAREVITALAGVPVADPAALRVEVQKYQPRETVSLTVLRAGGKVDLSVQLEAAPEKQAGPGRHKEGGRPDGAMLPFAPGIMKGGLRNLVKATVTVIENGQPVDYTALVGGVNSASDTSVTVNPRGGGAPVTYQITAGTKLRAKGSALTPGQDIVAISKGGSSELSALIVMPERRAREKRTAEDATTNRRIHALPALEASGAFPALEHLAASSQ